MKKARVEAFSDAVIAIILTIMVLEIKTPEGSNIANLLQNGTYFLAFTISFIFICNAWYNHHYVLSVTRWFSKRAFWANNFWLFTMALLPVATAWVSEYPTKQTPEYFYFFIYVFWDLAYYLLSWTIYKDQLCRYPKAAKSILAMRAFRRWMAILHVGVSVLGAILIFWMPVLGLILTVVESFTWFINIPTAGEHIED